MMTPESAEPGAKTLMQVAWHTLAPAQVFEALASSPSFGLSESEASARLAEHGPNELPQPKSSGVAVVFLRQFQSPLIYLLLAAAGIAFAIGEKGDAAVILAVVTLNGIVGAVQEQRAERSMKALRKLSGAHVRVLRSGTERRLEARELVPGDLLVLAAGDAVGGDARVVESRALETAEAALTGESTPVAKTTGALLEAASVSERANCVFAGTHVTSGRGLAVIVATGRATEVGRIAELTESAQAGATPLERRVARLSRWIVVFAILVFLLAILAGLLRGFAISEILMVAIAQLVSTVPEGLPVATTIALAIGVQRMAQRRTIVRRLAAVESLGCTTVICSDKTGTLTKNEMTVAQVCLPGRHRIDVSASGWNLLGQCTESGKPVLARDHVGLEALVVASVLCNDAELASSEGGSGSVRPLGDPTEAALLVLARKAGLDSSKLRGAARRTAEIPFAPESKWMATAHAGQGGAFVIVKGAPEVVLAMCSRTLRDAEVVAFDAKERDAAHEAIAEMARAALRILAFARLPLTKAAEQIDADGLAGRMTFLGLVGEFDPPRPEAREAVQRCRSAGIRVVMVTGDHAATAEAIAREIRIVDALPRVLEGREVERLADSELAERLRDVDVFARVLPAQKLRIVEGLQRSGEVVAVTGDGVNDAPALAHADVGVAMGLSGTEVAKEASDIVITDDRLATIADAVAEGRLVFRNLRKAVLHLFATGSAEVLVLLAAVLAGYPLPLAAVQILWNNVVTEGLITVNLALEPAEGDEMRSMPIARGESIVTKAMFWRMAMMSSTIAVICFSWFAWHLDEGVPLIEVRTSTFALLSVCEWFNILNCRSATRSAIGLDLLHNPWLFVGLVLSNLLQALVIFVTPLCAIFHTVPLSLVDVVTIGAVASPVLWIEEVRKWIVRRRTARACPVSCRT